MVLRSVPATAWKIMATIMSWLHMLRNLALRATAFQSSTLGGAVARKAVDGNRNSIWDGGSCSRTDRDRNPWWRVDLGKAYKVTRVIITNRGDCYAERINGAQIRIGNSLENNGNNNELAEAVVSIPLGETKTFNFKPINGRYVNIVIPGRNEFLTLCEVESWRTQASRHLSQGMQRNSGGGNRAQRAR
ncbi:unnamed protein product [Leuciscus chuanchicus]